MNDQARQSMLTLTVYGITSHGLPLTAASDVARELANDPEVISADAAGTLDVPELLTHYDRSARAWRMDHPNG